jgi:signal peptidase I
MKPFARPFSDAHYVKCELASEVLRSSGELKLQVTGWSMLPTVWPGDVLMIDRVGGDEVSEGDIVLFLRDRRLFVHRVVARDALRQDSSGSKYVATRGDSMSTADLPVAKSDLLGRVSSILHRGKWIAPRKSMGLPARAVAGLVRRSDLAARVVVGVHGMLRAN